MTNKEKYKDILLRDEMIFSELAVSKETGQPVPCVSTACKNCKFFSCGKHCVDLGKEWLHEEYEEPQIKWSEVPVDTKILVRNKGYEGWCRRYFSRYKDGKIFAFELGKTSWNAIGDETVWDQAKLWEEDAE